jgi:hypothetical protein
VRIAEVLSRGDDLHQLPTCGTTDATAGMLLVGMVRLAASASDPDHRVLARQAAELVVIGVPSVNVALRLAALTVRSLLSPRPTDEAAVAASMADPARTVLPRLWGSVWNSVAANCRDSAQSPWCATHRGHEAYGKDEQDCPDYEVLMPFQGVR